jgi:hypothetical protein
MMTPAPASRGGFERANLVVGLFALESSLQPAITGVVVRIEGGMNDLDDGGAITHDARPVRRWYRSESARLRAACPESSIE